MHGSSDYQYKETPTIIMKGNWLKEFGFDSNTAITVECADGKLIIIPREPEKHIIRTIIEKDGVSRVAEERIEQIFPLLGVRFIAVTSNYDSSVKDNPTMDFEMAVSNLINTFYSRDLSRKMRSAQKVKWQKGITTSGHPPFGYIKDPADKKKWILDPEASKIVRR